MATYKFKRGEFEVWYGKVKYSRPDNGVIEVADFVAAYLAGQDFDTRAALVRADVAGLATYVLACGRQTTRDVIIEGSPNMRLPQPIPENELRALALKLYDDEVL